MLAQNVLHTIGNTPHIRINRLFGTSHSVYVKSERANPGGSIKDRAALANDSRSDIFVSIHVNAIVKYTQSRGIEISGKNLANVNNTAYARQRVEFGDRGTIVTPLIKDVADSIPTDPIPLRRFGQPDEVAETVFFLADGKVVVLRAPRPEPAPAPADDWKPDRVPSDFELVR